MILKKEDEEEENEPEPGPIQHPMVSKTANQLYFVRTLQTKLNVDSSIISGFITVPLPQY